MKGRKFVAMESPSSFGGEKIPVFCSPTTFTFSATDRDQLKQILTIYNPYDFPFRFRVLATRPDYYDVLSPEGSIQSKNCVDLIIQLTSNVPDSSTQPVVSKFRIEIFHYSTKRVIGRKDLPSEIVYGQHFQSSDSIDLDAFQNTMGKRSGGSSVQRGSRRQRSDPTTVAAQDLNAQPKNINYVAIITAIACIIGLLLPDKESPSSIIPFYLHPSVNQKLLIAYTLGLVTMALFRPT